MVASKKVLHKARIRFLGVCNESDHAVWEASINSQYGCICDVCSNRDAKRSSGPKLALRQPCLCVGLRKAVDIQASMLDIPSLNEGVRSAMQMSRVTRPMARAAARNRAKLVQAFGGPAHTPKPSKWAAIFAASSTASRFKSASSTWMSRRVCSKSKSSSTSAGATPT